MLGATAFIGVFSLLAFHFIAIFFYLYWFYWWLDMVMHFLGGLSLGLLILWFYRKLSPDKGVTFERSFFCVFGAVFVVALAWEIFEFFIGYTGPTLDAVYWIETLADIVSGLLGGSISVITLFYARHTFNKSRLGPKKDSI